MELATIAYSLSTVTMQGMLGCKIDEECCPRLRKTEGVVVHGDDVGVNSGFDPVRKLGAAVAMGPTCSTVENLEDLGRIVNDTESVGGTASIEHMMPGLYARAYSNRRRALENGLSRFVIAVPGLDAVAEEEGYTDNIHFPSGVQSCIVKVGEEPDGGGEVAGKTDRTIE